MARDEVDSLHQALEEAQKRAKSLEGRLREEMELREHEEGLRREEALKRERAEAEAWKVAEDLWQAREFTDVANAARVSAEGDAETLRVTVGEVRRELEEAQASEEALRLECQRLAALVSEVARITSDAMSGLRARFPLLPSDSKASLVPLF